MKDDPTTVQLNGGPKIPLDKMMRRMKLTGEIGPETEAYLDLESIARERRQVQGDKAKANNDFNLQLKTLEANETKILEKLDAINSGQLSLLPEPEKEEE